MKFHRHLFLDEINLPPASEWSDNAPGWRFLRLSKGVAYWLSPSANKQLSEGEVVVISPLGEGSVRASQLSQALLHCFQFCPELLGGFLTLSERHSLEAVVARNRPAVHFVPSTHPAALQIAELVTHPPLCNGLFQRCEALYLAATFFAEDLTRHKPPQARSTYALHRFRELIQQMPDKEILNQTPEALAQLCDCSPRHFCRLFRRYFGVSLRTKQIELRLLLARQLLMDTDSKIIQVAMESGYRSLGLFNVMFKRAFGMTPTEWRRKHTKKIGGKISRAAALLLLAWPIAFFSAAGMDVNTPSGSAPGAPASVSNAQSASVAPTNPPPTPAPAPASDRAAKPAVTNRPPTFEVRGYEIRGNSLLPYEVNYGEIKAQSGGSIFMVAEKIENHGVLSAPDGTLGLYAGKEVLISERPDGRGLSASVRLPEGSIDNTGKLIADAGTIALHAQVVNNNGLVQANSVRTKNGVIEFVASEKVELGAQSLVQAAGDSSDLAGPSDGGAIRIKSAQSFEDHVGSRIEVTGGVPGGHGGSVEISASSMTAVRSQLEGRAVPGWRAGDLLFDPTDITLTMGSGTGTLPSGTVNAGDPPSSLRLDVNSAFANFSQIHLQATHDITLEPGTTWDLNGSTGRSDPGSMLTLEAGHDIVFGDNSRITGGQGWSMRLAAGVNFSSPSLAVTPGAGSIYFNSGPPDVNGAKPNGNGAIETFDGNISLAAGHDVLIGGGFVRTTGGGSIDITTGDGDVDSGNRHDIFHTYDFNNRGYTISRGDLGGIGTAAGAMCGSIPATTFSRSSHRSGPLPQAGLFQGGTRLGT